MPIRRTGGAAFDMLPYAVGRVLGHRPNYEHHATLDWRSLPAPDGAIIEWRVGSALELPLVDATFDLVLCQQKACRSSLTGPLRCEKYGGCCLAYYA